MSIYCIENMTSTSLQVKSLKEKIENEKGKEHFPAGGQKLIYAGEAG